MTYIRHTAAALSALAISFASAHWLLYPVLMGYPRLVRIMTRFAYTEQLLIAIIALVLIAFYGQLVRGQLSAVFLYLSSAFYLFLLFVVLFTKAHAYHALTLNPFDFLSSDRTTILEAILNIIAFIPLGMIYSLQTTPKQYIVIATVTIVSIETIQYLFYLGTWSISDILLNLIGTTTGFCLWRLMKRRAFEPLVK
ncbi:MAG: VanZ family protein [Streptococcaceae bacterium]|jgi:glycopeptide antibiotics resistance protein|nr:VanZ family protein [Streptococcaceae bacterium]